MVTGASDSDIAHFVKGFEESHHREFGFNLEKRRITVDNIRVRSVGRMEVINQPKIAPMSSEDEDPIVLEKRNAYFEVDQ